MTERTRYFLVGSALVLVVGLCTGLVAYYSSSLPAGSAVGPAEFSYVPPATSTLAYADVRDIMDSEFRQKLREILPTGQGKDQLLAETGIDVERDIDTVLVAFTGEGHPLVFVRGQFDAANLESRATTHGAHAEDYRGTTVFLVAPPQPASPATPGSVPETPAMALLEPGLLAFGSAAGVRRAVDAALAHADITGNAELMRLVADVQTNGNAWVVGDVTSLSGRANGVAETLQQRIPSLRRFALSAQIDREVNMRLRAQTADAKSADDLRAMVNGLVATARMMGGTDARMTAVLDSVQAAGLGDTVELTMSIPADLLEHVGNAAGFLHHGPASAR